MPHPLHELPQKQALLPCFLFQIPAMTIARSSAATTAATIMVGQFINTLLFVTSCLLNKSLSRLVHTPKVCNCKKRLFLTVFCNSGSNQCVSFPAWRTTLEKQVQSFCLYSCKNLAPE